MAYAFWHAKTLSAGWLPIQVLRDYRQCEEKPGNAVDADAKRARRAEIAQFLTKGHQNPPLERAKRLGNKLSILAMDHALQIACDVGLAHYLSERPIRPLGLEEERYYVAASDLPAELISLGQSRRACVLDKKQKKTRLELIHSDPAQGSCTSSRTAAR